MEHLTRVHNIESTDTVRMLGGSFVSVADPGIVRLCAGLNITVDYANQYKEWGEECTIPDAYEKKDTFAVRCSAGAHMGELEYPWFDTVKDPDALEKYSRTVFCQLHGKGDPFLLYDVSGVNACKAMKRLIGARDGEFDYGCNQAALLFKAACMGYINPVVLSTLKVQFPHWAFQDDDTNLFITTQQPTMPHLLSRVGAWKPCGFYRLGVRLNRDTADRFDDLVCTVGGGDRTHAFPIDTSIHGPYTKAINSGLSNLLSRSSRSYITDVLTDFDCAHWKYYSGFCKLLEYMDTDTGRLCNAEIEHVNKKLRQSYVWGVVLHEDEDNMVKRLNACVKKELGKFGKVPRLYVSYDAGCMYANELPELIKVALSTPFFFERGELHPTMRATIYIMSKPKEDSLSKLFQELITTTTRVDEVVVAIYSDDSVIAGNIGGVPFGYNVDISSCDASNQSLVFALTGTLLAQIHERRACGLISQCMMPIVVTNPNNPAEKFTLLMHSAFEGSGTVLTTILNHVASFLIYLMVIARLGEDASVTESVVQGARLAGHLVTVEPWVVEGVVIPEKMQFLKHSPLRSVCGQWVPTLNFGALCRSFGSIEGDLLAKHLGMSPADFQRLPVADRMNRFCGGVVRGFCHEPSSRIMDALRERFLSFGETTISTRYDVEFMRDSSPARDRGVGIRDEDELIKVTDRAEYVIADDSICRRYDLQAYDLDEFAAHVANLVLGSHSVTQAATMFYQVDYGLPGRDLPAFP